MNTDYKILNEKITSIQENLDLHIRDTDKEIGDMQSLRMEVAYLKTAVEGLREVLDKHVDRVSNRVVQAVEPILEEAQSLGEKIEKKRFRILREPWSWKKLFKKGG